MSTGPIPPLAPDDLKFVAEPSDFTGLVGSELGNLGTDQDGFDEIFNDAATLAATAGAVLDSNDQDLADASFALSAFDENETTNLLAGLQPAADAADTALAQFNTDVPPDPTGGTAAGSGCPAGTVVDGLTVGQPDPNPYPPVTIATPYGFGATFPVMCTGDAPASLVTYTDNFTIDGLISGTADLIFGDTAIFSLSMRKRNDQGRSWLEDVILTIKPAKQGRFTAVIYYDRDTGNAFGGKHASAYNVTIVDPNAPAKPGPVPILPGGIRNPPAAK
jgi:hypothetical protein